MSEALYDLTPANLEAAFRRAVARPATQTRTGEILGWTREHLFIQEDLFPMVRGRATGYGIRAPSKKQAAILMVRGRATGYGIRAPSKKQAAILMALSSVPQITLAEAVRLIGRDIYCNAEKHVGAVLSNMVRRGMIERVKPGVFRRTNTGNRGFRS